MASFNSLPLELVAKVIDLATEDYVALEDETSRRRILSSLSLVSTIFILPTQQALWEFIETQDIGSFIFMRAIREGFGRDKKVKRLIFTLEIDGVEGEEEVKWLLEVLRGIKSVGELHLDNDYTQFVHWPSPFGIAIHT